MINTQGAFKVNKAVVGPGKQGAPKYAGRVWYMGCIFLFFA